MRRSSRFVSLAAAAAAAISAQSGEAAPMTKTWERIGAWEVVLYPGVCFARRVYAGRAVLRISDKDGRGLLALDTAAGLGPISHRMSLIVGGERRPFVGRDVLSGSEWGVGFDSTLVPMLSAASSLEVRGPDGAVRQQFDLEGLGAVLTRLPACHAEAGGPAFAAAPPPPPRPRASPGKQSPPRAQVNLASLFSSDDYPEAAWEAGEEGAVGFWLRVDKTGFVALCEVTSSSGSAELD